VQHNFQHLSGRLPRIYLCTQPNLLKAIRLSDKYAWAQPQALQESSVNVSESKEQGELTSVLLRNFAP